MPMNPKKAAGCNSLLGVDLSGSADDPLASAARASLASRLTSVLIGVITIGIGIVLIANRWSYLLGGVLIGTGLMRFLVLARTRGRSDAAFLVNHLGGALIFAFSLLEAGTGAGLDVWGMLVIGVPPLLMGPRDGRLRRLVYAASVTVVAAAEILAHILPPGIALSPAVLPEWRIVNFAGAAIVLAVLTTVYRKTLDRAEQRYAEQQQVSERLLANILPAPIAERLKRDEYPIADAHEAVTVMFADGVNFSEFAAHNRAETVVDLLNRIVGAFDDMALRHGIEKIKTMGDAYMAAGGLTGDAGQGAVAIADLAFDMLAFVRELGRQEGFNINLRIGMHTGSLVAGVIGKHKFSYDVWGDTVNTASRLETASEPGRVHISEATARALGPGWLVEPRAPMVLKGLGQIATYFLSGRAAYVTAAAAAAK